MKKVFIWPSPWNYRLKNTIFTHGHGLGGAYRGAFQLWKSMALEAGYQLDTWDMSPMKEADVLWFIDLPRTRSQFEKAKEKAPRAKTVLMICESPLICPQMFHVSNRRLFDMVATYEPVSENLQNPQRYYLPVPIHHPLEGPGFEQRRLLAMVNSNRIEGYFGIRQTGMEGLPGVGKVLNGWKFSLGDLFFPNSGDLYKMRRRLGRVAAKIPGLTVDLFGNGWNGEQISWIPFYPNPPYPNFKKKFVEDRLGTLAQYKFCLAFENWQGDRGYITDRIFDGFLAGTVPVYLGDDRIQEYIPEDSFIDARQFKKMDDLLKYLVALSQKEWEDKIDSGKAFLASEKMEPFTEKAFARRMVNVLTAVTKTQVLNN